MAGRAHQEVRRNSSASWAVGKRESVALQLALCTRRSDVVRARAFQRVLRKGGFNYFVS